MVVALCFFFFFFGWDRFKRYVVMNLCDIPNVIDFTN